MKSLLLASLIAVSASGAELEFYKDVYPFLKTNCISCHNKTTTKADLNMETPELMIKGGESGPALVPGKGSESLVVAASQHKKDMEMPPPNNKSGAVNLTPTEIAILTQWIDQGAKAGLKQEHKVVWQPLAKGVDPIYTVAISKDGRYAACGRSNQIYVYDLSTRQFVAQVTDGKLGSAHRALVQSLAFSPDGTRLASGSYREVKVWKLERGAAAQPSGDALVVKPVDTALLKKLADAAKTVITASAMSPDGKQVVAGCADGSVRVFDVASAKAVSELRGSVSTQQKISALEWTVAAQTLEQAFQKSEVDRIEAQDKALDELLKKANDAILAMKKVLPEKQKAVKPASDERLTAQKSVDAAQDEIKKAQGKPDAALEKKLKDAQDKLITAKMTETSAVAASTSTESNIKDAEDEVRRITDSKANNAKLIATAKAAGTAAKATQDKAAAELAAVKQSLTKAGSKPLAVAFSSDAQRVAALLEDGTLRTWGTATGLPVDEITGSATATTTLTTAPDGSFAAVKKTALQTPAQPRWVLERALEDKGLFIDRVNAVRFSPDGKLLATGGGEQSRSGDVVLFDVATGKAVQTWKERHADTVLCLDFSPDGKLLATGAADKIAKVSEVATGKQVNLFDNHTHHVMGVAFRSDGRVLATAGADGVVLIWDMIIGERKKKIEGWTKEVTSLQYIGATNQIVTSAGDNRVRIITDEGSEVRAIANLPDYMQSSVSTPNGSLIVGGGEDSFLRVWDGTNGKEVAAFAGK